MTKQEAIRRLYGLIADINAEEVADHIKSGVSLQDWTNVWRCRAKDVLQVLEDTADIPQTDCYMCKWMGDRDVCGRCRNRNLFAEADTPQTDKKRSDAVQGFRGGKIPPKETLDGTAFIPKNQWIEMERELAELKEKFASAKAEWILCDERMPNEDGYYLVTLEFDYGKEIEMGWLLDGEWVNENSHATVAWMPLPEPYKGGDDK